MNENEYAYWLRLWQTVIVAIVMLATMFTFFNYQKDTKMASLGYQKVPVAIGYDVYYQKGEKP